MIGTWYSQQKDDEKDERLRIVEAAAITVCEDIRSTAYNTTEYPNVTDFMKHVEDAVPETLCVFSDMVIRKNRKREKEKVEKL